MDQIQKVSLSVIAPSFKIPDSDLNLCIQALEKMKVQLHIQKPLFKSDELCAHTSDKRFKDLKKALSTKADFIWCLRGGYGALHLLPQLIKLTKPTRQSKLIGFSDITILHYFFNQMWNWPSLHWKHLNGFLKDQKSFQTNQFVQAVQMIHQQDQFTFESIRPVNLKAKNLKSLKSKVVGGNLITLQSMVGLKLKKPKAKLLFLEEIDEPIYKIDRALTQLEQNGWFDNIDGILLGSFTHKNESIQAETANYLKDKFKSYKFPVFSGLCAGHTPMQQPLFFNTPAEILIDKKSFRLNIKNGFKFSGK
jgi:muramoyltetrapeptide carboxypeptidase